MKLLVHACCGPCSIMPVRLLSEAGHDIALFYANSNIAPRGEYEKRLAELQSYAAQLGIGVAEGAYDPDAWERDVAPVGEAIKDFSPALGEAFATRHVAGPSGEDAAEGDAGRAPASVESVAQLLDDERRKERCRACYRLRLEEAAARAAQGGYDALATTLAVSPYQFTDVIRDELERACGQAGIDWHFQDYRPYYDEATRISRELGMYRQSYCGCRFSVKEAEATRAFVKAKRKAAKVRKAADRAQQEAGAQARRAEKQAYAQAQARKRAILKALRSDASDLGRQ